jgi:hypothetical protein
MSKMLWAVVLTLFTIANSISVSESQSSKGKSFVPAHTLLAEDTGTPTKPTGG